jgi:hypothetical protein
VDANNKKNKKQTTAEFKKQITCKPANQHLCSHCCTHCHQSSWMLLQSSACEQSVDDKHGKA